MNKLNNLLQNFDYILTIISTIKYLKTEKLLEIHVLFLLQIKSENIKIANFCANIIHFYYLRYFKLNNINSFFFRKLRYSKLSTIFQIFVCFWLLKSNSKRHSTNILTPCIGYLSDYRKRWDFDGNIAFETVHHGRPDWI